MKKRRCFQAFSVAMMYLFRGTGDRLYSTETEISKGGTDDEKEEIEPQCPRFYTGFIKKTKDGRNWYT